MKKIAIILSVILVAASMRLMPHPANVTPLCAIALFGAAYLNQKFLAIMIPLVALFLSDLVLNNVMYAGYFPSFQWFTSPLMYVAVLAVILIGFIRLRQISARNILIASVIGSLAFFLISNLWSWQWDTMYSKDMKGLVQCYVNALPFLWRSMAGDLFFAAVMFGVMQWEPVKKLAIDRA